MRAWVQIANRTAKGGERRRQDVIGAAAAAAGAAIANGAPQSTKVRAPRRQRQLAYALPARSTAS